MSWPVLLHEEIPAAMQQVEQWGYPRSLVPDDRNALWLQPYPGVYVWLESILDREKTHVGVLHLSVSPEARGHVRVRSLFPGIYSLARSLRMHSLWVLEDATSPLPEKVGGYLERLHWTATAIGYGIETPPE